jgi:hypothetical protein
MIRAPARSATAAIHFRRKDDARLATEAVRALNPA